MINKTKKEIHSYWKNEVNTFTCDNSPYHYACKPSSIINFLHNFWIPEVQKTDKILELGCNSGANLNHLKNIGYTNLSGIEINESAIKLMSEVFNKTYSSSKIYTGDIEQTLSEIPDKSIDITFSIASLEHIHPNSENKVFIDIKRITKKYIITIEDEDSSINRIDRLFVRNYKNIFENINCTEIKYKEKTGIPIEKGSIYINTEKEPFILCNDFEYDIYTSRMFKIL